MPPLKVEYAKSGRGKCANNSCKGLIEKDELRIGTGGTLPGMDEISWKYRHLCCFTKRQLNSVTGVDVIDGYDDIDPKDQKWVDRMICGELIDKTDLRGKIGRVDGCAAATAVIGGVASPAKTTKAPKKAAAKRKKVAAAGGEFDSDSDDAPAAKRARKAKASPKKKPAHVDWFYEDKGAYVPYSVADSDVIEAAWAAKGGKGVSDPIQLSFSHYDYELVFGTMKQRNVATGKERRVRRGPAPPPAAAAAPPAAAAAAPAAAAGKRKGAGGKKLCKWGNMCFRSDAAHLSEFSHDGPPTE
eukprot:TRINITY_DN8157_c1_g1_i3.p1 TRINITY_DN8157_c1_g1~~TRINITY_DN8157_c1_g1_i3.p1  ORF type:complete len:322 (+),score=102.63 TRINITY_DN8157_c1_g1_i3:69-968(+)